MTGACNERASRIRHLPWTVSDHVKCCTIVHEEDASARVSSLKGDLISEHSERLQHGITDVTLVPLYVWILPVTQSRQIQR